MSALEDALIDDGTIHRVRSRRIDKIIAGRFACRQFSDRPIPRQVIEEILSVARFAPSGANIQPWRVYVLAGTAKERVSAALLEAHAISRDEHVSEYKYYATDLPEPYLNRRQEFGRCSTARLASLKLTRKPAADRPAGITRSSTPRWD